MLKSLCFQKNKRFILINLILLGGAFTFISIRIVSYVNPVDSDFFSFWLAGKVVREGYSPYNKETWLMGHEIFHAKWISDETFLYPIPLAVLMIPLSYLDLSVAYAIWVWISQLIIFLSTVKLLSLFGNQSKFFILPVFAGVILFRPIFPLLLNGQVSALLLGILVFSDDLVKKQNLFWGGVLLSISILKPNLGIPLLSLIGTYLLISRQYSTIMGLGLGLFSMFLISFVIHPGWMLDYFQVLVSKQTNTYGYSPSIWGLTFLLTGKDLVLSILLSVFVCLALIVMYLRRITSRKNHPFLLITSIAAAMTTLITPYLWPYDQIILIVPIVFAMTILFERRLSFLTSSLFFLLIDIIIIIIFAFSIQLQVENLQAVVPLTLTIFLFTLSSTGISTRSFKSLGL